MPSEFARHWTLDPSVTFLSHGSYGAAPRAVLAAQQAGRDRMEEEPVRFLAQCGIQVMVTPWPQRPDSGPWRRLVRISAAAYNDVDQFAHLAGELPGAIAAAAGVAA